MFVCVCLFACLFACLFVCLVGWLVGWLLLLRFCNVAFVFEFCIFYLTLILASFEISQDPKLREVLDKKKHDQADFLQKPGPVPVCQRYLPPSLLDGAKSYVAAKSENIIRGGISSPM